MVGTGAIASHFFHEPYSRYHKRNRIKITSEKFDSEQFEIPVYLIDGKEVEISTLATKSKILLSELLSFWSENQGLILKIHKKGSGFYTKYTVTSTNTIYDRASGKFKKLPAKKSG